MHEFLLSFFLYQWRLGRGQFLAPQKYTRGHLLKYYRTKYIVLLGVEAVLSYSYSVPDLATAARQLAHGENTNAGDKQYMVSRLHLKSLKPQCRL